MSVRREWRIETTRNGNYFAYLLVSTPALAPGASVWRRRLPSLTRIGWLPPPTRPTD